MTRFKQIALAWPLALAYLIWKLAGYPVPAEWRAYFERTFARPFEGSFRTAAPFGGHAVKTE